MMAVLTRRAASGLLGLVGALLLAELVLRLLPIVAGVGAADPIEGWPAYRLVPHSGYVSSSGWALANVQRGRINNAGYIAPFDYREHAQVGVVLGDSFVEGYMNPYSAMLQARLADALGLRRDQVYNFGSSGASLPHYLGVARLVGQRFAPQWAVVLVTPNDFVEGFEASPGFFVWNGNGDVVRIVPQIRRGRLTKFVRDLALVRYARGNLKFRLSSLFDSGFASAARKPCRPRPLTTADEALVRAWRDRLPGALALPPERVVLVFNSDRDETHVGLPAPPACASRDSLALGWLKAHAAETGMRVVDTAPLFAAAWAADHRPLDRAPLDAHWNPHGHAVIARAVASEIARMPQAKSRREPIAGRKP